jgi:HEAT repeat protein
VPLSSVRMIRTIHHFAALAMLLTACGRSTPLRPSADEPASTPPAIAATTTENDASTPVAESSVVAAEPASTGAKDQLEGILAHYGVADEQTRMEIEEHILQLENAGIPKTDLAKTLGAMFAMETSIPVKWSILNELYTLGDPSALEYVTVALSADQPLEVRKEAIGVLQEIGDKRALPYLSSLLADPNRNIREQAQDAIDWLQAEGH